jgi:mannose-6-phosphate isomerase-like protein (cupin superfamily)
MTEQYKIIAERIKGLREISNISAEALAKDINVPKEQLLEYESGAIDIPVGFLMEFSQKLGVDLSSILSGEEPKLHIYSVTRKDKGINVERRKQYKYQSLAYNFINKKAEPFIVIIDPDKNKHDLEYNSHAGQEFNYIIEGTMKIVIESHEIILKEGDSIYFDSGFKHAMTALNRKPVKMLVVVL